MRITRTADNGQSRSGMAHVVERNIRALLARRRTEDEQAGWVVLSACNTAADDGSGEALSGLARAFFYAGAAALLVSQWSVDDVATRVLMTEVFRRQAEIPDLLRADALRQGMLAVMTRAQGKTAYFAHPYAWAPFMLVGEGGRGTP